MSSFEQDVAERIDAWREHTDAWLSFSSLGLAENTIRLNTLIIHAWAKWCSRKGITMASCCRHDVAAYMAERRHQDKVMNSTIGVHLRAIRTFFNWTIEERFRTDNPVEFKKLPKLRIATTDRVWFTPEQYEAVLAESKNKDHNPFFQETIVLLWHTGLRISDVACMIWDSVDLINGVLRIPVKKMRWKNQILTIPMSPELLEMLSKLREHQEAERPGVKLKYVVPMLAGYWLGGYERALRSQFKQICVAAKAGCDGHVFHAFRHGFVTRLLNAGVDPITIASITGHSLEQLKTYAHVSIEAKRAALTRAAESVEAIRRGLNQAQH